MRDRSFKIILFLMIVALIGLSICFFRIKGKYKIGQEIDSYKHVEVYNNGDSYIEIYGENYSEDGYYYGYKWQCVEFVKRFYYEAKKHKMPDVYGNAKDFFDYHVAQGQLNEARNLLQYRNGGSVKPKVDDLIVFTDSEFGHVAIITKVKEDYIEIIQQNVYGKAREEYKLVKINNKYYVGTEKKPAGWLRKA